MISILRMFGIRSGVSHAEIDAAEAENIERSALEHSKAVERIRASSEAIAGSNSKVRESIQRASARHAT